MGWLRLFTYEFLFAMNIIKDTIDYYGYENIKSVYR